MALQAYLKKLTHLRQGTTAYGKAPHKPVLLMALLDGLESGWLRDNRVYVSPELVASFRENWALLVDTPHQPDFTQPFYYLQTDGFWQLVTHTGQPVPGHVKSLTTLMELVQYGTLDEALYSLLLAPHSRAQLRAALLDTYFPRTRTQYLAHRHPGSYIQAVEHQLLHEPPPAYGAAADSADEEETFVRGALFKKLIPRVYNYACCISGMRVISTYDVSLVDACHIVPFSVSRNDSIGNGLALCPNLHRAFDRGLISIDEQYRVLVSGAFGEEETHPYGLRQLLGKPIALPFDRKLYPTAQNLTWHREQVFKR